MFSEWAPIAGLATFIGGMISTVWYIRGWISSRFDKFYEKMEKLHNILLDKLEYHERHDDSRFDELNKNIWLIRLRNASRDNWAKEKFGFDADSIDKNLNGK